MEKARAALAAQHAAGAKTPAEGDIIPEPTAILVTPTDASDEDASVSHTTFANTVTMPLLTNVDAPG